MNEKPNRCTEPPFALGTGALAFWNFDQSRLGGRWSLGLVWTPQKRSN